MAFASFVMKRVSFGLCLVCTDLGNICVGDLFSMKGGGGGVKLGPSTKLVSGHCVKGEEAG